MDFLRLVVLGSDKGKDFVHGLGWIRSQRFVGHLQRFDLVGVEPAHPAVSLFFEFFEAARDHVLVVSHVCNRRPASFRRGPHAGLHGLHHRYGLRDLVGPLDIDVVNR